MVAPNVVRGASHSGNFSAQTLAEFALPAAIRMVTLNPAQTAGLADRGEIAIGQRADLAHVRQDGDIPVVRSVWREGVRVA